MIKSVTIRGSVMKKPPLFADSRIFVSYKRRYFQEVLVYRLVKRLGELTAPS